MPLFFSAASSSSKRIFQHLLSRHNSLCHRSFSSIEDSFLLKVERSKEYIDKINRFNIRDGLSSREKEIDLKLSDDPNIWDNTKIATELSQQLATIRSKLSDISALQLSLCDVVDMYELAHLEKDNDMIHECEEIMNRLEGDIRQKEIDELLSGPDDRFSCYIQIIAGAGGTESCDWTGILLRMYLQWAVNNNYSTTIMDEFLNDEIGAGGYKSVTVRIKGDMAYGWMKNEAGVHRLVRISPFDTAKKRHTSFAQVLVYPEIILDRGSSIINPKDVKMDTFRSSGAGGQSVQKTDSAVRLTHIPTGIVVSCQNERSQHQNKSMAMTQLQSRINQLHKDNLYDQKKESTLGGGDISWGNQIRSVVIQPYQMVKDHRTGYEVGNVEAFLEGVTLTDFMIAALKHSAEIKHNNQN